MKAIQIEEFGGPEVLQLADVPIPEPGEDEVLIRVSRAGMNYADTHQRTNSYLARYELPVHPDQDVLVALVVLEVVRAVGHGAAEPKPKRAPPPPRGTAG